jgi:hypothetical protein
MVEARARHMRDIAAQGLPRVVYLGGLGRSGSTLLERLLGELPGVRAAGEVVHLWRRGVVENERCGCGEPFASCPFWRQVGEAAFGGWDRLDMTRFTRLRHQVDRMRHIPVLASPPLMWPAFRRGLDEYLSYYLRLYAAIGETSGCGTVVDSSKHASLAFCLSRSPRLDLRVVHVVRDSRAVAYAWTKQVSRPEAAGGYMSTHSPASSAAQWHAQNAALHALERRGTPTLRVRYEDVTADPAAMLRKIAAFAGLPADGELPFLSRDGRTYAAELGVTHTASGNPMRFSAGRIVIRRDDTWRDVMPRRDRRLVSALTLPSLARYGYLRGRRAPAGERS